MKAKCNPYHVFFKNLANPLRTDIVTSLRANPLCVSDLAKKLKVEQSKLSHALSCLKSCSIVRVKQKGKNRVYSLNKKAMLPILKFIDKNADELCREKCPNEK